MAGVVGRRKFSYDVWGDAVNVAARTASSGEPGQINVSDAVFERVRQLFDIEERGSIETKNKEPIEMAYLLGIRDELTTDDGATPSEEFHRNCARLFRGYQPAI